MPCAIELFQDRTGIQTIVRTDIQRLHARLDKTPNKMDFIFKPVTLLRQNIVAHLAKVIRHRNLGAVAQGHKGVFLHHDQVSQSKK